MSAEEWIEKCIREEHIKYYEFSEFSEIREIGSELFGKMYKTNWKQSEKCIVLRSFNLDHATIKEIIREIKLRREVDFNDMMMKFYGITKTSDKEYLLVLEYAEGGTLRNYLKEEFTSLDWQDKYRLAFQLSSAIEYLHEKEITYEDLNSNNIFMQQNSIKLADFGLSKRIKSTDQISFDTVPYDAPEGFNITGGNLQDVNRENKQAEKLKKSDVYSTGVLFWELSSGKRPFADKEYNISLAREISQGLREGIVEGTPKEYSNLYAKCWDSDPDKRPTIQEVAIILQSMISSQQTQQMIKQLKLNHGLFLNGYRIEPSKQAVLSENGILNISLYREQPLIYTYVNNHGSHTNLLSFALDDNNELNEALQPSDICINFPVAEITYNANLLESFSNFMKGDEALYETYGHLFARKLLVGGTLFIDDFKSITSKQQIDSFKFLLTWVYNSVKYNKENPFNNLSSLNFFPKLRTSGGEKLHAPVDLTNWMNKLYQDNMLDVISYTNLILISELRLGKSSSIDASQEKQPGIANFKEKLSLEDWVSDSIYINLARWVKEFHLLQGIIISEYLRLEISKRTAVSFVNVPSVYLSDIFYLDMIKPTTNLEKILISNNIFPNENARDISTFPFMKGLIKDDNLNHRNYTHFLVRRERYKILLSSSSSVDIKPSEEFKLAIKKALESMRPFVFLQNVFDEYGHLFPLTIVLGKSLKNILPNSPKKIELRSPTFEPLKSHLDNLNISYLLTKKGNIFEKNDLSNWINDDDNLEIIGFENVISLYDILEIEQRRRIDVVLNKQDEIKIIMTGIVDLEDLDNNNIEHYKRINVKPSLESENYEVFGSIISDHGLRIEDFSVTFGLYDFNGFSATIKTLNNTSVNITECFILWTIVGNPSDLSVFSPKNRDIKVNYVKKSIALKSNNSCYSIKSCQLSEDYTIFLNYYCSKANYEPIDIKLVKWSNDSIDIQIVESNNSNSNANESNEITTIIVDVHIFILSSDYKSLKIDNDEKECNLNLIGYTLTEDIYRNNSINIFINELLLFYKNYSILKEKRELIRKHIVLKKEKENEIFNYLLGKKNKKQNIIFLADFYKHGIGTEKDEIKAFELYKKAAEKGQIDLTCMLGKCYQNGEGTEKNLEKAFHWFQKAAENGDEEAIFNLAKCYYNGEGTEKNLEKAFYWLQKATENGDEKAMFILAMYYKNGEGTEKNLEKAFHWLQKAAEKGQNDAIYNFAVCYRIGVGTDILPEIFQIILKYIYSGIISLDEYDTSVIIKILIAANKLCLKKLIIFLQYFLIEKRSDWMELNPSYIYRISFENNSFTELQKYCDYLISKDPDKIFKSLDLFSTPEKLLVKLIQNDKLQMSKIQVWEYALKWGHAQNPELPSDLKKFSKKDFKTLKNSLQRCIQFIKFYNLTSEEFSEKILPYKKIFPKELYEDLSKYFSNLDKKSIKEPEPYVIKDVKEDCLKNIDSKIITFQHAELILKWINTNNSNMNTNINAFTNTNMFKLLLRGTRDGFTPEKFHEICNNKSHTVTIIKVKGSNEILGGYNPNTWKSNDMYDDTKDSFIFSFKNNLDIENHILSRIKLNQLATFNGIDMGPSFSGSDLTLSNNVGRSIKITYERPIREITDDFLAEEYEVFEIIRD
ncbi:unnamed protein product [Rhizophagus irregularis]|nr:unnamed protein product [Rhizophagus irregularis]